MSRRKRPLLASRAARELAAKDGIPFADSPTIKLTWHLSKSDFPYVRLWTAGGDFLSVMYFDNHRAWRVFTKAERDFHTEDEAFTFALRALRGEADDVDAEELWRRDCARRANRNPRSQPGDPPSLFIVERGATGAEQINEDPVPLEVALDKLRLDILAHPDRSEWQIWRAE